MQFDSISVIFSIDRSIKECTHDKHYARYPYWRWCILFPWYVRVRWFLLVTVREKGGLGGWWWNDKMVSALSDRICVYLSALARSVWWSTYMRKISLLSFSPLLAPVWTTSNRYYYWVWPSSSPCVHTISVCALPSQHNNVSSWSFWLSSCSISRLAHPITCTIKLTK